MSTGKTCRKCGGWKGKVGEFVEWNGPVGTLPTLCRCDDTLTFAEAMALDPSEVDVFDQFSGKWQATGWDGYALSLLRKWTWRRSRPKRSRVEEMCERDWGGIVPQEQELAQRAMTAAIRAVCEYLRSMRVPGYEQAPTHANAIERHFLEPR